MNFLSDYMEQASPNCLCLEDDGKQSGALIQAFQYSCFHTTKQFLVMRTVSQQFEGV